MTTIFVDSGIFIAFSNNKDRDHKTVTELMQRIRSGEFGQPYTSDYVFDESLTAVLVRSGRLDFAINVGKIILGSASEDIRPIARLLKVDEEIFHRAWNSFASGRHSHLSFTDHTILAQIRELKIDYLASLDSGFDGLVKRLF
jgi:uncharacterized protein